MKLLKILALLGLLNAIGCASVSTLQTAKTLEPGKTQPFIGAGFYSNEKLTDNTTDSLSLPILEGGIRHGIAEQWDFGVKYTMPATLTGDIKYQFLNAEKFNMALGFVAGWTSVDMTAGSEESSIKIIDLTLPLYASYDLTKSFALYASPKYLKRFFISGADGGTQYAGATGGAKIGEAAGVFLEYTMLTALGKGDAYNINQGNVAVFWQFE